MQEETLSERRPMEDHPSNREEELSQREFAILAELNTLNQNLQNLLALRNTRILMNGFLWPIQDFENVRRSIQELDREFPQIEIQLDLLPTQTTESSFFARILNWLNPFRRE